MVRSSISSYDYAERFITVCKHRFSLARILMINKNKSQDYMEILHSPKHYLYNLHTTNAGQAKRLWRQKIKENWDYRCAYCGSGKELSMDHIIPRSKGGPDFTKNVVCCCVKCNQDKGQSPWEEWYLSQEFFSMERYQRICNWMKPDPPTNLFVYRPRRNNAS